LSAAHPIPISPKLLFSMDAAVVLCSAFRRREYLQFCMLEKPLEKGRRGMGEGEGSRGLGGGGGGEERRSGGKTHRQLTWPRSASRTAFGEDLLPFGFPSIDMGPQLKVVERTRTATMLCAASGIPDPEISWFKDFLPVDHSTSRGRIKQLRSDGVQYGREVDFWVMDGAVLTKNWDVIKGCGKGALQIENSEETDQGKYECVATNSQGVRYSSPANLYVRVRRVPPRFSIFPSNHEIMPGGSVNITCVAVGSPMPYVKWMLGTEDLTPEDEMPIGRNVLELNSVRESANYTCVAMSSLGTIESIAQVLVKTLPKPPGTPIVTETTATSVTITWDSGNPDPVSYYIIQYRAKGPDSKYETVDSITTTRYSIGGLYPNTEYEIRVSAFNSIGQGPPSTRVEARTGEQAPASPPRNVQAHIISQNTVMVRWEEPEEPNGQVKGYRVYYTMDPSRPMNEWQIHNVQDSVITTIQSLITSETYTIQVLAFTSVGDGPFSDPVHVKVMPGVPGQPGKFRVGKVTDTSIEVTWEPAYTKEGIINYELLYKPVKFGSLEKLTFGPRTSYTVEGLKANTEYSFSLAAISSKGIGAFTNELMQRTSQAKRSTGDTKRLETGSFQSCFRKERWYIGGVGWKGDWEGGIRERKPGTCSYSRPMDSLRPLYYHEDSRIMPPRGLVL
ncbi:unnamed protein product, partial [Pleuronectes platessa]